ncbi:MAG: histidinol-phosphatase [Treponemataceae bacterium]|nr:histidinol-phosphatase [Treponemataceae bacterium]
MNVQGTTNFHTHTELCRHAVGRPADYTAQAAADGAVELGFSDHCPYPESCGDYWPEIRMTVREAGSYCADVRAAAAEAAFPVHVGFECEWDAAYENWLRDGLLGGLGAEYLILGSHWLTCGRRHVYAQELCSKDELFRYIRQTIDGIRSGLFAFLAHPDLFMKPFCEWDADIAACSRDLIDAAVACGVPLEVNGLGMQRPRLSTKDGSRYQYPYKEFWQLAAERGAQVVCSSDAHAPADVVKNALAARQYAAEFGFVPIETIFPR